MSGLSGEWGGFRFDIAGDPAAPLRVIRLSGAHDGPLPAAPDGYCLISAVIDDWFSRLSPWAAPPVFGGEAFGGRGADTLAFLTDTLLPRLDSGLGASGTYLLAGYSLAGLFALWAGYESDRFAGVAAVSPSLWFPGWEEYAGSRLIRARAVYLSLGRKEEKARHALMRGVGDGIRAQQQRLSAQGIGCVLEWNPGNHFQDSALRTAKGIDWLCARFSE